MFKNPLILINISTLLRVQFLLPVLFLFYQENGLNTSDYFFFRGLSTFAALICVIPFGYISDLFSKKYILILSFFIILIQTILWMFFYGYYSILIGSILGIISKTLYFNVYNSYIYEYLTTKKQENEMSKESGKISFYFSIGIAATSIFSSILYSKFGSMFLLVFDFIFLSIATFLLFFLPNIKASNKKNTKNIKHRFFEMYLTTKRVIKNKEINYLIFLYAIFTASTIITAFLFQPIMKISYVPVWIFGIVSFLNYLFRSLSSFFVKYSEKNLSIKKLSSITYSFFIFSFLLLAFSAKTSNKYLTLFSIFIACISIALEVLINIIITTSIHKKIFFKRRAATESVKFFMSKIFLTIFLFLFKVSLDYLNIQKTILIYCLFFSIVFYFLNKHTRE